MLSIQHVLCGMLHYEDPADFRSHAGALVLPDGIRAWSGPRQYSHFEQSEDGKDVSWWAFPSDLKHLTKEAVQESLETDAYLVSEIRPCVLGEETNLSAFYEHNSHLPKELFEGIEMHLRQDKAYDAFVREQIDCSGKYEDHFTYQGQELNGKEVRSLIGEMEQQGIYLLAQRFYEERGITANQEWIQSTMRPLLYQAYPEELAEKTLSFMKIDPQVNEWITDHDFSHLANGPVEVETYQKFYERTEQEMSRPTVYYDLLLTDQDLSGLSEESNLTI